MTGQIHDKVCYTTTEYNLVGQNGAGLFEPSVYQLFPQMLHTACWRGYICSYAVEQLDLLLTGLTIRTLDGQYPPLSGISPIEAGYGAMRYLGLHLPLAFHGNLLLGAEFIHEKYVHMGFQAPQAYRQVVELTFLAGKLVSAQDRSAEFAKLR